MKRLFLYSLMTATLLTSIPTMGWSKDDWFDQIDKQFEDTFQKTDAAFNKAMREGVSELDKELENIWGEARQLPEPKKWVGYSKDRKTRYIVDYERGEMSVEGVEKSEKDLFKDFQEVLFEDTKALDQRAALRSKLIEKTQEFWREDTPYIDDDDKWGNDTSPAINQQKKRIKRKRSTWKPIAPTDWSAPREISTLFEPRTRPTFVRREAVIGGGKRAKLARLVIPLRKDRDQLSAKALRDPVISAAEKYNLPKSLILSVIKNESAFNPRARSHANALGLMQLVATSGGKDAYSFLQGREATPGPEILYDPYENIMLGATYLHILNTRYFGKVKDVKARQYLIICAYNTGAGNVAKAFTGKMKLRPAIDIINRMKADEIYDHLKKNLPYAETKTYLTRVSKDTQTFASWDEA